MTNPRLTPAQVELLRDIATHPQMFVRTYGRYGRTAGALIRHHLARVISASQSDIEIVITALGRDEATRRDLTPKQPSEAAQ